MLRASGRVAAPQELKWEDRQNVSSSSFLDTAERESIFWVSLGEMLSFFGQKEHAKSVSFSKMYTTSLETEDALFPSHLPTPSPSTASLSEVQIYQAPSARPGQTHN